MRVLILSCNTGQGHNSCAEAIREYCVSAGDTCIVEDGLRFLSPTASKLLSRGHVWVYRHAPRLFSWGYGYTERHPAVFRGHSPVYRFLTLGGDRIGRYLAEGKFDAVVCTHVFTALMLTDALNKRPFPAVTCFVATDYTCSPSTNESALQICCIPDRSLVPAFTCPNTPPERMLPGGIPVRQSFYRTLPAEEAKQKCGIPPASKHLLMMCGSMGCGPIRALADAFADRRRDDLHLTVVCGTNRNLQKKLERRYGNRQNLHIRGYVKDMSVLMDSADLYLTKAGGISVTEAAVKQLPMVLIDAVAGCEQYNSEYFVRLGGAATAAKKEELADLCIALLDDDERRMHMKKTFSEYPRGNAAACIRAELYRLYTEQSQKEGKRHER